MLLWNNKTRWFRVISLLCRDSRSVCEWLDKPKHGLKMRRCSRLWIRNGVFCSVYGEDTFYQLGKLRGRQVNPSDGAHGGRSRWPVLERWIPLLSPVSCKSSGCSCWTRTSKSDLLRRTGNESRSPSVFPLVARHNWDTQGLCGDRITVVIFVVWW